MFRMYGHIQRLSGYDELLKWANLSSIFKIKSQGNLIRVLFSIILLAACKELSRDKVQDQCDCKYFYHCVPSGVGNEKRALRIKQSCALGTRFDAATQSCSRRPEEDEMGDQTRFAPGR